MSKTSLTTQDVDYIRWAKRIRHGHRPARRGFRKVCVHCRQRWGRHGCHGYLWATDFLSQFSLILVPDRPERPRYRHTETYTAKLRQATEQIRQLYRSRSAYPRPLPV